MFEALETIAWKRAEMLLLDWWSEVCTRRGVGCIQSVQEHLEFYPFFLIPLPTTRLIYEHREAIAEQFEGLESILEAFSFCAGERIHFILTSEDAIAQKFGRLLSIDPEEIFDYPGDGHPVASPRCIMQLSFIVETMVSPLVAESERAESTRIVRWFSDTSVVCAERLLRFYGRSIIEELDTDEHGSAVDTVNRKGDSLREPEGGSGVLEDDDDDDDAEPTLGELRKRIAERDLRRASAQLRWRQKRSPFGYPALHGGGRFASMRTRTVTASWYSAWIFRLALWFRQLWRAQP
jgi:hypothetical protein